MAERKRKRRPVVAIDLDGVLAVYHGFRGRNAIGQAVPGARRFVRDLRAAGWCVTVWTCRETETVKRWLEEHRFEVDGVNVNPEWPGFSEEAGSPKIPADVYIDDRGVGCPSNNPCWHNLLQAVGRFGPDPRLRDAQDSKRREAEA